MTYRIIEDNYLWEWPFSVERKLWGFWWNESSHCTEQHARIHLSDIQERLQRKAKMGSLYQIIFDRKGKELREVGG